MTSEREPDDRTEEPTPRRREEARRTGDVPRSAGLVLALSLLVSFGALAWTGPGAAASIRSLFGDLLGGTGAAGLDTARASALLSSTAAALGIALLPPIGLCLAGALAAGACRGGAGLHPGALGPAWSRSARGRGAGAFGAVERAAALAIAAPVFVSGAASAFDAAADALARGGVGPAALALVERIPWIGLRVAAVLVLVGIAGRLAARWRHERSLRMSRNELRDERDLIEGSPLWKRERRKAEARVLARVRSAEGAR